MSRVIAIIGGGAAGFFCAAELKRRCPDAGVTIYEAQSRPMAKLAITGGGRCNLTNTFERIGSLKEAYPRGERLIRAAFGIFSPERTLEWRESECVRQMGACSRRVRMRWRWWADWPGYAGKRA